MRADELPATPDRDTSAALERVFAGEDRLRGAPDECRPPRGGPPRRGAPAPAPDGRVPGRRRRGAGGRSSALADGLPLRGAADAGTIRLVQLCDGRRRLREVVAEMARSAGTDAASLTEPTLAVARRLVALGFLEPAGR